MHIDELLTLPQPTATEDQKWHVEGLQIPSDWTQGRTVYGGLSAGMITAAVSRHVRSGRVLRSLNTNFIGPLNAEQPFSIDVHLLREGSNVSQINGQIVQDGRVCVFSQACYGEARPSKIEVVNNDKHNMPAPRKAKFIPQIPKVTPKFLRHIDLCIEEGGVPFLGAKTSHYHGYMRFTQPPAAVTDAHIVTLLDAWPPTLLQMLRWPAPASTVSWSVEFIHPHRPVSGADWFAYQAHTRQAAAGYGHTEATIWDKDNEVIALSRQTVAVFD